jgi:hypothetical protein
VKVTERPALVEIAPSSQQMTAHAGLVLVLELAATLALPELLDGGPFAHVPIRNRGKCGTPVRGFRVAVRVCPPSGLGTERRHMPQPKSPLQAALPCRRESSLEPSLSVPISSRLALLVGSALVRRA